MRIRMCNRLVPWGNTCSKKKGMEEKPGNIRIVDLSVGKDEMKVTSHRKIYFFQLL